MKKILFEDVLILSVVKTLRTLVRVLPLEVSLRVARGVGRVVYYLGKRRKVAHKNLRAAFATEKSRGEMKRIAQISVQNLALSAVELLRFPDMDRAYVEKHMRVIGMEKFEPVLRSGKGIIFLTGHFGNWEFLSIASSLIGYPMTALAREQKHPRSDAYLNSLRNSQTSRIVYKGMSVREILKTLQRGGIAGILSDQDGGRTGTFVRFFDRLSSSPSGVATFAIRTGAPIYPCFDFRESVMDHRVEVEGPLEMPDPSLSAEEAERFIMQQFAEALEAKIRRSPEQWLWAHRRWKSTPDRSVIVLSDGKAGHLNQSMAAVRAIEAHMAAKPRLPIGSATGVLGRLRSKVIEVKYSSTAAKKFLDVIAFITRGHLPFKHALMKFCLDGNCYEELMRSYADIVISCGASAAAVNLLVAEENQAKSLVIMKPPFGPGAFDAVIVPRHDGLTGSDTVFITEKALSAISEEMLEGEAKKLAEELKLGEGKKIGLLLGGDTDSMKWDSRVLESAVKGILRASRQAETPLLATTSRRTPAWADALLKRELGSQKECPFLIIANEANRPGTVAAILGLSDLVIVSGESISMVSEALTSNRPVIVFFPADETKMKPKLRAFLDRLAAQKRIILATPENISAHMLEELSAHTGTWSPPAQDDREVLKAAAQKVAQ